MNEILQNIIISHDAPASLAQVLQNVTYDRIFVLVDDNTSRFCLPLFKDLSEIKKSEKIEISSGDTHKTLDTSKYVWEQLVRFGATRRSLLVNIGGGMVTDLGGFVASIFKRGIVFINVPTTLLAMVDASVGGKTGVNFHGLKNEIGVFNNPYHVIIDTVFLATLDRENILSGYAEMIKHGLISDEATWLKLLAFDIEHLNLNDLRNMVSQSVTIKKQIVDKDPTEKSLRKVLNLGHTIGHAIESFALRHKKPLLHGYAIAYGLVGELYLSTVIAGFPTTKLRQTSIFIGEHYGHPDINCDNYDELFELMTHDKKNVGAGINFSLLTDTGNIRLDSYATKEMIFNALDFCCDGF